MSQFKYEKLIIETAKALQCFIEEYKRDKPKFLENKNQSTPNNPQQPNITELTEDKIKLITTYALFNLSNINNQKEFNIAVEQYLNNLKTDEDGKTYVRYNNTWKEVDFNSFQGRSGRDGYTPYIQNGKWFLNNVDLGVNATGESAYDIAKRLNKPNTDTESNWINSLKGDTGAVGQKGEKGDKGTGISSITLSNETDKTYLNINLEDNTNSKLLLPLLKGDKGEPGRDVDPAIINRLNQAINNKVDKVDGKQLSTNDFTTAEKQKLESIDLSTKLDKGTYSGTAKDLNDKIEQILTLLRSNNVNLDTLQEIVDYITLNRTKLEALGISNIAGLTQALSDKAPLNHNHDDRYMLKEHKPTWNDVQNKPDNLATSGNIQDLQRKIDQVNSVLSQKASTNHTHNWNDIQSKPSINKSGNVYTIPGIGGNIEIPSWVTQTKPTYDWTEIQNKPEIDIELKYKRLTEVTGNITDLLKDKPGVFRVGDSARLQGMPNEDWYHFFGGRHYNGSEQRNYYFALRSHTVDNYFWLGRQNNTENVEWFKFVGFKDLNNNKLFREWNLEHGLSAYIGNSNVFNIRTGFSGGASDLLFSLDTEKAYFSKFIVTDGGGILFKDKTQIHVRDNGNIVFGNKPFNDLVIGEFKGIQLWGQGNDRVILAGGGVTNLSELKNENIKVGGRNVVLNSKPRISQTFSVYGEIKFYDLSQNLEVGETYILTFKNYKTEPLFYLWDAGWGNAQEIHKGVPFTPSLPYEKIFVHTKQVPFECDFEMLKLERGNTPTDWSPAPEDLESQISTAKTATEAYARAQAELTKAQAIATADGKITEAEQRQIQQLQLKLQEAKTFAEQKVNELNIGGRNLFKNSGVIVSNNKYNIASYQVTENIKLGETVTLTIDGDFADGCWPLLIAGGGNGNYGSLQRGVNVWKNNLNLDFKKGDSFSVFIIGNDDGTKTNTIRKIKLERGNKATDWTPAPEDLENNLIEKTIVNNEKVLESKDELPIKTGRTILMNNYGSRVNLGTDVNELTVTTLSGWARINSNGYKIQGQDDNYILTAGGNSKHLSKIFNDWESTQGANIGTINTFKAYNNGAHRVDINGEGGILAVFKTNSSASSIELLIPGYGARRLHFTHSIDNNRYAHPFKELAYFEDVLRAGVECTQNTTLQKEHQNQTLFVTVSCNIELNAIDDLSSVSFRKVFDSGVVSFSCTGKNIIYTSDNQFNGKKGSTAVISRYGNDCYIDIRNI